MTDAVVRPNERHRRKVGAWRVIVEIDAVLTLYAREHGGRFIRYGSTATGRVRQHSGVDIITDFEREAAQHVASAPRTSASRDMIPHVRSSTMGPGRAATVILWHHVGRDPGSSRHHFAMGVELSADLRTAGQRVFRLPKPTSSWPGQCAPTRRRCDRPVAS